MGHSDQHPKDISPYLDTQRKPDMGKTTEVLVELHFFLERMLLKP